MKYGEPKSFSNSTSRRVENQLKTIELTARKIEKERVAIVSIVEYSHVEQGSIVEYSHVGGARLYS